MLFRTKFKSAFSLIELSIVILIIGVLIAGVIQGSKLLSKMRLSIAQAVTISSAVNGIPDLLLWLEPTLEKSFKTFETVDGAVLTVWYDINPQTSFSYTFTNVGTAIKYQESGPTNSLPAVQFLGTPSTSGAPAYFVSDKLVSSPFNAYTVFYVARSTDLINYGDNTIFLNGNANGDLSGFNVGLASTTGYTKISGYGGNAGNVNVSGTSGVNANQAKADIFSITFAPNSVNGGSVTSPAVNSWKNGVVEISSTLDFSSTTDYLYLGNKNNRSAPMVGEISELIIFSRALSKVDRQEVEKYLSKKYAISITQS